VQESVRFGRFEVRPTQRQLLIDGQLTPLGARAFDVLLALIERRGRLIAKNELLDAAWPGLVVEENNLQVQISTLRKLLGAKAIATIPGHGYRFALSVDESAPAVAAVPAPAAAPKRNPLPQHLSPLVDRVEDVAALLDLCAKHSAVTLVGPGGIGKTRLAQELARRRESAHAHGVAWVDLAPIADASLLAGAVTAALGIPLAPGKGSEAALLDALRPLDLLIVLDNAEHLIEPVAHLARTILRATSDVRLLVTSQAPLRIDDEAAYRLSPLDVPPPGASLAEAQRSSAVALLVERTRATDRRFALTEDNCAAVIDLTRRLDGMPLALQLAAARIPAFGVQALERRLDQRFALLRSGARDADVRHVSLHAVYDWSYGLLSADEQGLFRRLGVFASSFPLDLARAVLADEEDASWRAIDTLGVLVERSMVDVDPHAAGGESPRYRLTETARAYALEKLAAAGESEAIGRRHAHALREFFATSPNDFLRLTDAVWLARYEPELENLRAAFDWARVHEPVTAVALVGMAAPLQHYLSLDNEARRWLEVTESALCADTPGAHAADWWRAAQWAWTEVAPARARAAAARANALYRQFGDRHGLHAQLAGIAGLWKEPNPEAHAALDEALRLESPDWPPRERAWGWRARADVARAEGRLADSRAAREMELQLRIAAGDERGRMRALSHLAELALALGDADDAVGRARELVAHLQGTRAMSTLAMASLALLAALLAQGNLDEARPVARSALALALQFDTVPHAADFLALLAALEKRFDAAARLIGFADVGYATRGDARTVNAARARERALALATAALSPEALKKSDSAGALTLKEQIAEIAFA